MTQGQGGRHRHLSVAYPLGVLSCGFRVVFQIDDHRGGDTIEVTGCGDCVGTHFMDHDHVTDR